MYQISESIEISRPPDSVLAWIRDPDARMRLNPTCTVIGCEQMSQAETDAEASYRFFLQANGKRFKCDIVQVVNGDRIVSRTLDGTACVTLSVIPTARGTRLLHEENFDLSDELLEPESRTAVTDSFWLLRQLLRMFFGLDYYEARKARKAEEIVQSMKTSLQTWLVRIREKIEVETKAVPEN